MRQLKIVFPFFVLLILFSCEVIGQITFSYLAEAPEKISNSAIESIEYDGKWYVYTFSGIDSTKLFSGIHNRCYKYSVSDNTWSQISNLPSGQDRIAAGASRIKNKIYILGGYEVFANENEVSINNLHVFDPKTDAFLDDAAPMPIPIDDQVQAVYKDSLLFCVSGWSNNGNVNQVWIYNPTTNIWSQGTSLPVGSAFSAFGASGQIIGDTLYFIGGATQGFNFNLSDRFRKAYINPENPNELNWIVEKTNNAILYRPGSGIVDDQVFWLGGSQKSYNYDGISYNGSGGVLPTNRLVRYDRNNGQLTVSNEDFPPIMDLRGLARLNDNHFISVGGMINNQEVSNDVILYTIDFPVSSNDKKYPFKIHLYPNPASEFLFFEFPPEFINSFIHYSIYTINGDLIYTSNLKDKDKISVSDFSPGQYNIYFYNDQNLIGLEYFVVYR